MDTTSTGRLRFAPRFTLTALLLLLLPAVGAAQVQDTAEQGDNFGEAVAAGDFDNDGFDDLAVGVHREDVGSITDAGAVNVIYGLNSSGLSSSGNQLWTQNSLGVFDTAEAGDELGLALAVGDFDGDGFDDLAIGVPGEAIGTLSDAGGVNVIYGSSSGLITGGNQFWSQASSGVGGSEEAGDMFGAALVSGDFDNDGFDDLAIGAPGEDVGALNAAGSVNILYGASGVGLTAAGDQIWHQDVSGVLGTAAANEQFGFALAAGDFDSDNDDDLAIGVPLETVAGQTLAGSVSVLYGSAGVGLTAANDDVWTQSSAGVLDGAESGDGFGRALAAGDFDTDSFSDLAIGVPYEDVGAIGNAGAVNVLYGASGGLSAVGDEFWHQDVSGVPGAAEDADEFGWSLVAGDFDGDAFGDLAIGVHFEFVGSVTAAGAVNVLYGALPNGLSSSGSQIWHQEVAGVEDGAESDDQFGFAVAAGDFDDDGFDDLAAGAWGERIGIASFAGAVNVLYGSSGAGITATGDQFWHQDSAVPLAGGDEETETIGAPSAAVNQTPVVPALLPAAPNPFAASAQIGFTLPESAHVRLAVYDGLGREVARLVDEQREAGRYTATLDGRGLPAGVYLVRMTAGGGFTRTQRVTLLR